jgi:hypothetical protein
MSQFGLLTTALFFSIIYYAFKTPEDPGCSIQKTHTGAYSGAAVFSSNLHKRPPQGLSRGQGSGAVITHQRVNDFLRCLPGGEGFCGDVFGGKIVHRHHLEAFPGGYTLDGGIYGGRGSGQQFIQCVRFCFGHHGHVFLLILVSQHTESLAASHGVKNISGPLINKVIHDFKHIARGIKPGEQKFIVVTFNKTVKQGAGKSPANTGFRNAVFEHGLIEQKGSRKKKKER